MKGSISMTVAAVAIAFALAGCEVEQTEEGDMPDVDVEGGEMPEYDVDAPDVDVGMEEKTVTVPDIDVDPAEEEADNPAEDEEPPPDGR